MGYVVNKLEFRDAICLRYGWKIVQMPAHCACGARNSIDHVLICKRGGYVSMRHNSLRNLEAKILSEVCTDVQIEPMLIPTETEQVRGNGATQARLDISARGVWSQYERTFFDVRISHPTADSHMHKSLQALYAEQESQKKRMYGDRVLNVERASFTPLVFTTTGGMSPECARFNQRVAELIAKKRGESYSHVICHLRTRLRFALLRATLIAIRGERGRCVNTDEDNLQDISFNLIPAHQDL